MSGPHKVLDKNNGIPAQKIAKHEIAREQLLCTCIHVEWNSELMMRLNVQGVKYVSCFGRASDDCKINMSVTKIESKP